MKNDYDEQNQALSSPSFCIWLCGAFRVERRVGSNYEAVRTSEWGGSSYPRLLLKALLCCPGRQARREALTEMLWPEMDPEQATHNLNTATTKLRNVLRPAKGKESLLLTEEDASRYRLEEQTVLWVDADAALALLKEAERFGHTSQEALPLLEETTACFNRGAFLDGEEGPWVFGKRATRERAHYRSRLWLAEAYEQQGMPGQAEGTLSLLLEEDPTDEDVLCRLMTLFHQQGMMHQSLQLYELTCDLLGKEGLEPGEATKALAEWIQEDRHSLPRLSLDSVQIPPGRATLQPTTREEQPRLPDGHTHDSREYVRTKQIRPTQKVQHSLIPISSALPIDPYLPVPSPSLQESSSEIDLFHVGITALILHQQQSGWDSNELEQRVTQALDTMIPEIQTTHQLSRRGFLRLIVGMPLALYGFATISRQSAPSLVPEEVIPLYAAGIPACWRLYYEGGQIQLEQVLPHYLSHLTLLTEKPSKLQKTAAGLLSQTYQLMALLAQGHERFEEAIEYCQQAAFYGHYAEDTNLLVMAYIRLQDTYWERRAFDKCFVTLKQAELFAEKASPLLQGRIFARLASVYSYRSELAPAQHYLDVAQQIFPKHPEMDAGFLYSHTTHFVLYANEVLARTKMGQPQRAWDAIVNAEKFVPGPTNPRKIDVTRHQILVAIALGDLEQCSALFEKLVHVVKLLGHELDKRNTYAVYQSLHERWPHEGRVKKMKQILP